mgnify:CR=1 FL=1
MWKSQIFLDRLTYRSLPFTFMILKRSNKNEENAIEITEIIPDEKLKLEEIHFDKNEWTNILPDNFDINKSLSYKSNGETIYFNVTSFTLDDNENKSTARDHRIRKNNTIMWEEFHNKYADAEEEKKKKSDTPQTSERGRSRPRDRGDPKLLFPDSIQ